MIYKMELTEEQYDHIATCIETCHRIACGDIHQLREILPIEPPERAIDDIKVKSFPELAWNEQYSWNGGYRNTIYGEAFRKEFDKFQAQGYQIYRQMLHKQNIAKGIDNVLSSPTLTTNKAEQPIIEILNN